MTDLITPKSRLISAFDALATRRASIEPFVSYERDKYAYGNNWTNLRMAEGVMERDGFRIPYDVRGVVEGRKSKQMTRLAIDLAGGPGSVITAQWKTNSSPELFRVATANWRGVGDTTPVGCLENNNTPKLVEDIEALRVAAGMGRDERVILRGGSWGMTVAAAYAEAYPDKVAGLVLGLPFLARRVDTQHSYASDGAMAKRHPQAYERFQSGTGKTDAYEMLQQYADEMGSTDAKRVAQAFVEVTRWEYARNGEVFGRTVEDVNPEIEADRQAIARARILTQYTAEGFYFGKRGVQSQLESVGKKLADVPVVVIAHRDDPLCAPDTLRAVQNALPKAEINVYDADWHWVAKENEQPAQGYDNSFVSNGYPYATAKVALALRGDIEMKPGVYQHQRPNKMEPG